eukprot:gene23413-28720_t
MGENKHFHGEPEMTWGVAFFVYISYAAVIMAGHIRDFFANITGFSRYKDKTHKPGFASLFHSWESFYTRRLFHRIQDCWGRPISSSPGALIHVLTRNVAENGYTLKAIPEATECINLGSYNYL